MFSSYPGASPLAEDYFDLITCYFPIQFKAKPNDPDQIDGSSLKNGFAQALASSPVFAPFAVPFLVEKCGDMSDVEGKQDACDALSLCIRSYGKYVVSKYSKIIWELITKEAERVTEETDEMLSQLIETLSRVLSLSIIYHVDEVLS